MINSFTVEGFLGRDPEKTRVGETVLAKVSLGQKRAPKKGQDIRDAPTDWFDLEAWGEKAEALMTHRKGDRVLVEGKVRQDRWKDNNTGKARTKHKVVVAAVGGIKKQDRREREPGEDDGPPEITDEDVPF
jgi:single stranded DNA-binding protein